VAVITVDEDDEVSMGRSAGDRAIVDEVLLAKLSAEVAAAAAATLAAARNVRIKADRTPVTDADERSQAILLEAMARLMPGVTVVSEETAIRPSRLGDVFALIDPLDGTKEYVAGSSEYTVNLAIIRDGEPVVGIVAVPAEGLIYRGRARHGAERLPMSRSGAGPDAAAAQPIRVRTPPRGGVVAAVSRSHLDSATVALLDRLDIGNRMACGSALKFCRIAEGAADIYPRLAPTCEWDVAAGHALVAAAGGTVTLPEGGALRYGETTSDFRVPAFIAWGDRAGLLESVATADK
jgi:3'(2'), 5'-bisphosphate nucleotidase